VNAYFLMARVKNASPEELPVQLIILHPLVALRALQAFLKTKCAAAAAFFKALARNAAPEELSVLIILHPVAAIRQIQASTCTLDRHHIKADRIAKIMPLVLKRIDSSRRGYLPEDRAVKVGKAEADKPPAFSMFRPEEPKRLSELVKHHGGIEEEWMKVHGETECHDRFDKAKGFGRKFPVTISWYERTVKEKNHGIVACRSIIEADENNFDPYFEDENYFKEGVYMGKKKPPRWLPLDHPDIIKAMKECDERGIAEVKRRKEATAKQLNESKDSKKKK
jgi:hypothetical protein